MARQLRPLLAQPVEQVRRLAVEPLRRQRLLQLAAAPLRQLAQTLPARLELGESLGELCAGVVVALDELFGELNCGEEERLAGEELLLGLDVPLLQLFGVGESGAELVVLVGVEQRLLHGGDEVRGVGELVEDFEEGEALLEVLAPDLAGLVQVGVALARLGVVREMKGE